MQLLTPVRCHQSRLPPNLFNCLCAVCCLTEHIGSILTGKRHLSTLLFSLSATLLASGPQGGTVTAGSSATILCTVSSYTSPTITISWYKDGLPFNSPNDGDQAIHTLVFPSVKLEDSGIYACSGGGAISNNFTLSVSPGESFV